jgi:hypothetical protein
LDRETGCSSGIWWFGLVAHTSSNDSGRSILFRERNDKDEARYRLELAIRYYEDWGALAVVGRLKKSTLWE